MFEMKDNLSKLLFTMIDPWCIDALNDEEKIVAQGVLMVALERKFDRRWLYGLGEINTKEAYDFVMDLYNNEKSVYRKVRYAYKLIWMNKDAPVLEYVQEIIKSNESEDARMNALSALYPLYDKAFANEEKLQLYLSILFDTMTNDLKKLRIYAYEMLNNHYEMNEFTSKDDPIRNILSTESKKSELERAVHLFEDKIKSIKTAPISRSTIVTWIKDLPNNPPSIEIPDCETCSTIPDESAADMANGESLDEHTSKLEVVVRFAYYKNRILRCPICGRFYKYAYEYEYLVNNSEEDEFLSRIDMEGIMQTVDSFMEFFDLKSIVTSGNFMKLTY